MSERKSTRKRRAIRPADRFTILERDDHACVYCGARPPEAVLHIDHVMPVSRGGTNEIENLVTACELCNLGKHARVKKGGHHQEIAEMLLGQSMILVTPYITEEGARRYIRAIAGMGADLIALRSMILRCEDEIEMDWRLTSYVDGLVGPCPGWVR